MTKRAPEVQSGQTDCTAVNAGRTAKAHPTGRVHSGTIFIVAMTNVTLCTGTVTLVARRGL